MRIIVNGISIHTSPSGWMFLSLVIFFSWGSVAWAADASRTSPLNREEQAFADLSHIGPTEAVKSTAKEFLDVEVVFRKLGNRLAIGISGRSMKARKKRFDRFEEFFDKKKILDKKASAFIDAVNAISPHDYQTLATCIDPQAMCGEKSHFENIACATRLAMCLAPHFAETAKAE